MRKARTLGEYKIYIDENNKECFIVFNKEKFQIDFYSFLELMELSDSQLGLDITDYIMTKRKKELG